MIALSAEQIGFVVVAQVVAGRVTLVAWRLAPVVEVQGEFMTREVVIEWEIRPRILTRIPPLRRRR